MQLWRDNGDNESDAQVLIGESPFGKTTISEHAAIMDLPRQAQDITADWVTETLRSAGILLRARSVASIRKSALSKRSTFNSQSIRVRIVGDSSLPFTTLIAKLPSSDLLREGVPRYSYGDCLHDSRFACFERFRQAVLTAMSPSVERRPRLAGVLARRIAMVTGDLRLADML
jgi:hypothetical protein